MSLTEHTPTPSLTARGLRALRGLLGVKGTGAPSPALAAGSGALSAAAAPAQAGASPCRASGELRPHGIRALHFLSLLAGIGRRGSSRSPAQRPLGVSFRVRTQAPKFALQMRGRGQRYTPALGALVMCAAALVAAPAPASAAATSTPAWGIDSLATPTDFSTAGNARCFAETRLEHCDTYAVTITNQGSKPTNGASVTITDTLPAAITLRGVVLRANLGIEDLNELFHFCSVALPTVTCTIPAQYFTEHGHIKPGETFQMFVLATVDEPAAAGSLTNTVSVSGGGVAEPAHETSTNTLEHGAPQFGLAGFRSPLLGLDGAPDTQAGAHPYDFATRIDLNNVLRQIPEGVVLPTTIADLRDVVVDLPLGLAASAVSAPTCTLAKLSSKGEHHKNGFSACPTDSIVGFIRTGPEGYISAEGPIYNIVPERGVAAEFGFIDLTGSSHILYSSIAPTPSGYVLRSSSREIAQLLLTNILVEIYGDPAARDRAIEATENKLPYTYSQKPTDVPTFTNPEDCSGAPLQTSIHMDSWQAPGSYNADGTPNFEDPNWAGASFESPPVTGCESLAGLFNPTIEAKPETTEADTPTGLDVNLKVPQSEGVESPGTPPLRDAEVALPEGVTVNPSQANGLQACSLEQVGMSASGVPNAAPPACPEASKIGTVELETPALPSEVCKLPGKGLTECPSSEEREKKPIEGSIYVARQLENPFKSLLAIYIVIDDPRTGVIVKLPGEVKANETTGQLTTVVPNGPQFPFSELRTHFFGGATASLRTPPTCGTYTLTSQLTPWSAPESGPPATPSSPFEVTQGPGGAACPHTPGEEPNSPTFEAGTTNPTAGAYSPLVVHMTRGDDSQNWSQISVTLPPGATGKLAGIPKCSDAQIAAAQARSNPGEGALEAASPSCPAASKLGTVTVGAGAGPKPFYATGNAYLAGPYKGAPFSGVFITPAIAGPFDLGVVVVRAGLYINPTTAQVTTKADPLPTILHGIPLDVRSITVNVDRPGFTLNPTSCNPMTVSGEEISTQGQTAPLSAHFQVGGCAGLVFKPSFTVSTQGKTSKAAGASLSVKIAYPSSGEANIAKVDLQFPKSLPARLTTLQKACTEAQFNTNPAGCPAPSDIATVVVHTPLLNSPLSGPAYFVSHGGAAFPDVEMVLQGEGVTLVVDGKTQIKKGVTYSHFESAPDEPFSTFEFNAPEGPYSILTANGNLCTQKLLMPTTITGQNGAVITQSTKIGVTGCPKVKTKALTRAQKLAKALKACRKDRKKAKRASCERAARKKFGAVKSKKAKRKK